jgi:dihydropteroate synthase
VHRGGASPRPGSRSIPAREEARRILPVLKALAGRLTVPLSVDTTQSAVAAAALDAGAEIVNDVSGLTFDPRMASVVARHAAGLVLSHVQGRPRSMQRSPRYRHLLPEVVAFLRRGIRRATEAGVHPESILVDPGIGFGKTADHNLLLLKHLRILRSAGRPILVGASRKSFLSRTLGREAGTEERLEGSLAVAALAVYNGAAALRVHDVAGTVRAARAAEAVRDAALPAGKG